MIYNIIINKTGGNTFNQRRITNGEETLSIVRKGILYSILCFYIETERNGTKIFEHINPHIPFIYTIVGNVYENPELLEVGQ